MALFAVNVLTPGASFILTISNAMSHGRRSGLLIALGLATADTLFAAAATAGLAALVSQSVLIVKGISLIGGLWFVWGGLRLILKQKARELPQEAAETKGALPVTLAYRLGFTAGAFNAQAIIFFSSMFTAALLSKPSLQEALSLVLGVAAVSVFTRCNIVMVFTIRAVMGFYMRHRRRVEALSGGALTLFGLKLALPAVSILALHFAG
jgi:threonine/homoserine/homoserine lactone efflux protein